MKLQENPFVHVGMELEQDANFSVTVAQADFAKNLQPLGTSPELWAARRKLPSPEYVKLRQCELGELCLLATVSRPDICARLSRINSLQGADVNCINDLVKTAKQWQPATVLKHFSSCRLGQGLWPRVLGMSAIARKRFMGTPRPLWGGQTLRIGINPALADADWGMLSASCRQTYVDHVI